MYQTGNITCSNDSIVNSKFSLGDDPRHPKIQIQPHYKLASLTTVICLENISKLIPSKLFEQIAYEKMTYYCFKALFFLLVSSTTLSRNLPFFPHTKIVMCVHTPTPYRAFNCPLWHHACIHAWIQYLSLVHGVVAQPQSRER